MPRGRKPIPTHLKILRGNPGGKSLPKDEPLLAAVNLPPPEYLPPVAAEEWRNIAPLLYGAGLLTELDTTALAAYCMAFMHWREANDRIANTGMIVKGSRGTPIISPYVRIANGAAEQMLRMLTEFGMTPSSRTRVTTAGGPAPGASPWDNF